MDEFGVGADQRFTMWDWVGGRYSVWSSIGLAVALAIGPENFSAFLEGGRAVDEHFAAAPLERNLPVLLGLIGVWNRNFLGIPSHAFCPTTSGCTASPPTCSSSRWRATASA